LDTEALFGSIALDEVKGSLAKARVVVQGGTAIVSFRG
jgi:hypothetical protein